MHTFGRILSGIERLFDTIVTIFMLAIMTIVFFDVFFRYVFNHPIQWAFDLIGQYLMAGVFFLALSRTYAEGGHVGVDILVQSLPAPWRRGTEIVACLVSIPLFSLIAMAGAERAYQNWLNGDALSGLIAWPTWVSAALVPIGAGLLVLRLALQLIGHVASLVTGQCLVPLTSAVGNEEMK